MTEKQKDCIVEIQELIEAINAVVKKHDLTDEFIACIAIGFLNMNTVYRDEEGNQRADMSLLSSFSVTDEEELDDLLSYCVEAYNAEEEESEEDPSSIDYWINLSRRSGDVN
tara:strand:+ start:1842 stop:2177 length:336 start_codon:yes stop_codon:yes gene_type:complete